MILLAGFILAEGMVACDGGGKRRPPPTGGVDTELQRCLKLSTRKKYEETVECLEVFKSRYPSGGRAAEADLLLADSYMRKKDYLLAVEAYQEFIKQYPIHPKRDYAYYKAGLAYIEASPKAIDREQPHLDAAAKSFGTVVQYFPDSPYASVSELAYRQARTRQASKSYYVARHYYKDGEYLAAIPRFGEIVSEYPHLGFDEKSFYYLIKAYGKIGQKDHAQSALSLFAERYPKSPYLKSVRGVVK